MTQSLPNFSGVTNLLKRNFLVLFLFFAFVQIGHSQFNTATVNGTIAAAEYGTHTDGSNQQTSGSPITYMTWDATNLYVGVATANTAEGFVIYFDKDNLTPVDGGTNSNGTLVGNNYDGTNFAGLPFRADIVMYVKNGYREFRTADGANGWSGATASFGAYAETGGNVREFSIPWTSFPGGVKPASFNWVSYLASSGGFVYGQLPTANSGGTIGTSARYERYYSVLNTATGTSTKPMSRDCYVFNSTIDNNAFGAISVADFTMNSAGRQIARVAGNWTISGTLRVNAGSIYYGNGGSYGSSAVGNGVVSGGLLDIDANSQLQAFASSLNVSGGTLNIGNAANNVTVASGISTVATSMTISGTGTANISNGTLAIGVTGGGNQALNVSGGTLNLTGNGIINLNGNFTRPTGGGQFNQSGTSLLSIDGNSGTVSTSLTTGVNSFNVISATGTGLNCSSGTIRIVDPHHSSITIGGPKAVSISYGTTAPTAYQFSGTHTFEFGNNVSTTGGNTDGFVVDNYVGSIRVPLNNVIVNSGSTANRWVSTTFSGLNGFSLKGNLTINANCEFRNTLSSAEFSIEGNIANSGILTSSQTIIFASAPIGGGTVVAATTAQTVSGSGIFRNLTASPTAKFSGLTFNNIASPAAVTFSIGDITTTGFNTFTTGIVDIGNNNNYTFGPTGLSSRTTGYVLLQGTGQMRKDYASGAGSFVFHIGENTGTTEYSPYSLILSANSVARTIGVRAVDSNHPNINDVDTQTDYISRYWQLTNSAAGTYTYSANATYLPADINGTEANMKMNMWSGASPWIQVSSSASANTLTTSSGLTEITCPIGTTAEFTGRVKIASIYTWNQTASAAYGTAANWTPNRNAPATDDILIFDGTTTPTPVVTGFATQAIGKLLFTNNANVNLQSAAGATLTISGGTGTDLDITSGSTLNLSGTQNIGIAFTGTTTATIAGTLKTSTTGTGTLVFTNSITTVTGTLDLSASTNANTSNTTNLLFSNGATCIMGSTSMIIPIAGWNANSNLNIVGIVGGTSATNNNQSFGNILYNCASQTSTVNFFVIATVNIQGNVEIRNTGSGKFRFGSAPTINIAGNLSITNTANCDIANGAGFINVAGSFIHSTTGTTDLAPSSSNATLRVAGTFNQTAGTITESSTSTGSTIEFNGNVSQSVTTATVNNNVNFRVNNAAGITLPTTLNINANALLRISNGTVTSGNVVYNVTGTTLVYDAISPQTTTSLEFPIVNGPTNLTINNTNVTPNVTLHATRAITGVLALSAGRLILGANDFTLGVASTVSGTPSSTKMVVTDGAGQLKKVFASGASSFIFPIGETIGVTEYSPNQLLFSANSIQRTIGVKVTDTNHPNLNTGTTPVDYLSRYWSFTDDQVGTYTYANVFTYVTGGVDVNGTESAIRVGRWDGSAWTQQTSYILSPTVVLSAGATETTAQLNGNDFSGRTTPNIVYSWTGATNSDWATNGNWDIAGFPNAANHQVIINTTGGNQPIIASGASYLTTIITINNPAATLTLNGTASLTTGGLLTVTAGTVTLNGSSILTTAAGLSNAGTINVGTGYLNLQTSFANTGTITSACTGTIEFGVSGGTIPQNITYGNLTVSGGGSFVFSAAGTITVCGNYSQPGATTASTIVTLANSAQVNTMTVGGNMIISGGNTTNTSIFRLINSNSATSNVTVAVAGDVTVSGSGRILLEATSAATASGTMTVGGNFIANGVQNANTGFVDFGTGTITGNGITIVGNYSVSNAASTYTSGSTVCNGFVFTGVGKTFSNTSSVPSQYVQYTVNAGASYQMLTGLTLPIATNPTTTFTINGTLDVGTNVIIAANATDPSFTLSSGATLKTSNAAGVQAGFSGFGVTKLVFDSVANYEFNGTVAQTANMSNLTMKNLTINNTAGVSLTQSITANGILDFQNGLLNSPTATPMIMGGAGSITNASATKYVNGKLNRVLFLVGSKTYPIGKAGIYRPVTVEYTTISGTSNFGIEQIETALSGTLPANTNLNNARTWDITRTGGTGNYKLTLDGTGDTISGTVVMLKKESGTITSNAVTSPNYTNTSSFTTITATTSFTLGSTCTITPDAGVDETNTATCGLTSVSLTAVAPTYGTGLWSIVSGAGGSFSDTSNATSTFTGVAGTAYNLQWTITNGNCSANDQVLVTFNQAPTVAINGSAQTICDLTAVTLSGNSPSIGTGAWTVTSGPSLNASQFSSLTNPTATFTADGGAGTYIIRWTISNSPCTISIADATITVNAPTVPTFTPIAPICSGDTLSALPATSDNLITGTWSPALDNTTTTTYTFTPTSGQCATTTTLTITVGVIKTWNAGWLPLGNPTSIDKVLINGDYTASIDGGTINGCSMTVDNNAVVVIDNNANIILQGKLTVLTGSVTINNNCNLLQTIDIANSGNITVKRNSSSLFRQDYTLWSSPVIGSQTIKSFSPSTLDSRFYTYVTNAVPNPNVYVAVPNVATTTFASGKGYLIRMPNNWSATVASAYNGFFTGVPTNGNQNFSITNGGVGLRFNAIGNPYPSDISMASFVAANTNNITGTLYFWRKTNSVATSPNYNTWTAGTFVSNLEAQVFNPNGIISVGQGFIVEAKNSETSINFNNGMRVADNTNHFFRNPNTIEYNRIWLNVSGNDTAILDAKSQMAVGYITDATQTEDVFDGKFFNNGDVALTSLIGSEKYAIQGRALPFNDNDVVPISFKATTAGNYNIAINHVDGLFSGNSEIYLKDNLTGTTNNLTTGAYNFATLAGDFGTRFELVYRSGVLATNISTFNENSIVVYKNNSGININSGTTPIENVKIFDIQGRLLIEKTKVNATQFIIDSSAFANQLLIVEIMTTSNVKITKKTIN